MQLILINSSTNILRITIKPNPLLVILEASGNTRSLQNTQRRLLSYGLLCGKKLILLHWKSKETPTFRAWVTALTDTLHLERIRYALNNKLEDFDKIWKPIISYLGQYIFLFLFISPGIVIFVFSNFVFVLQFCNMFVYNGNEAMFIPRKMVLLFYCCFTIKIFETNSSNI